MRERDERAPRWRRRTALAVSAAALLAGSAWRLIDVYETEPRLAVVSARSSVVGTWKIQDGHTGHVELAADGRFSAVGLPVDTSSDGYTGAGKWSLDDRGGSVLLTPDQARSGGVSPDLAVVRADGRLRLCVTSGSPGVLCDFLLQPAAARQ
ncbi:hypothetical protein ACF1A5_05400 [Streptomyces sp. NPDC014864]|uniref:hypothetical protein n=1 Tax=Streptomyces sp. NPDC014864 TaxID=3364924 RepID=UPI0036FCB5DE